MIEVPLYANPELLTPHPTVKQRGATSNSGVRPHTGSPNPSVAGLGL